jgi:hypothetical protein
MKKKHNIQIVVDDRAISLPHEWILEGIEMLRNRALCNYFCGEKPLASKVPWIGEPWGKVITSKVKISPLK